MMLNLKKGIRKVLFLDKGEDENKTEKSVVKDIKSYDRDIEDLKIEIEALNKEVEKIKKKACMWRNIFLLFTIINFILIIYFGYYFVNTPGV
jgi:predicted RNase H-like nuclease (RuvC/YqgF family)